MIGDRLRPILSPSHFLSRGTVRPGLTDHGESPATRQQSHLVTLLITLRLSKVRPAVPSGASDWPSTAPCASCTSDGSQHPGSTSRSKDPVLSASESVTVHTRKNSFSSALSERNPDDFIEQPRVVVGPWHTQPSAECPYLSHRPFRMQEVNRTKVPTTVNGCV